MRIDVGGRSAYAYSGSRAFSATQPTVVFVHGAAHDHSVWALQSRYFAHHGRNAIAVDLPGHGRSAGEALPSIDALAEWLVRLLDALGVPRASLVGHSMGALSVLEAAARDPERVEKLVLIGVAFPLAVSERLQTAAKANDHAAFELIDQWSFAPSRRFGGNRNPGLWMSGNSLRLMERSRPNVLHTDLAACNAYGNGLVAAASVRCSGLLILGEADLMAPPRNARALADTLPSSRIALIPDCGHAMMVEQPDAVLDALRGFL